MYLFGSPFLSSYFPTLESKLKKKLEAGWPQCVLSLGYLVAHVAVVLIGNTGVRSDL